VVGSVYREVVMFVESPEHLRAVIRKLDTERAMARTFMRNPEAHARLVVEHDRQVLECRKLWEQCQSADEIEIVDTGRKSCL